MKNSPSRMQKLLTLVAVFLVSASVYAESPSSPQFHFVFRGPSEAKFEYSLTAHSELQAFQQASSACLNHFFPSGQHTALSEDQKMDLVDVCANPKKI